MTDRNGRPRRPKVSPTALLDALGVQGRPRGRKGVLLDGLGVDTPSMSAEDRKALASEVIDAAEGRGRAQ